MECELRIADGVPNMYGGEKVLVFPVDGATALL